MKYETIVDLTKKVIAQTLGSTYMEQEGKLAAIESGKLVDIGKDVSNMENGVDAYTKACIDVIGKYDFDTMEYAPEIKSIMRDNWEWGAFLERIKNEPQKILTDDIFNLVDGKSYSDVEHTFYKPNVKVKLFTERKGFAIPISFTEDRVKTAFTSMGEMAKFFASIREYINQQKKMILDQYAHVLVGSAIAISDKATHTAVHLKTEAIAQGVAGVTEGDTVSKLFNNPDFLVFTAHRIAETMDNAKVYSEAFNDGSRPTFTDTDYARLMVNNGFIRALQFNVESKFFNPEKLSFGKYDKITSWQGIKDSASKFTPELTTKVAIAGDTNNKLGIGTGKYTSNCIALFFDKYALGICPYKRKVTSQYTASADFWTEFHHTLVNMIIDSSFNLVAFLAD